MTWIELHDVQGIIASGFGDLPEAAFVLLAIEQAPAARRWIAKLDVCDGITRPRARAVNIALSHGALELLGIPRDALAGLASELREGMAGNAHRSRCLGDVDGNEPARWNWGGPSRPVDVLLLLYAAEGGLEALVAEQRKAWEAGRLQVIATLDTQLLRDGDALREHFGFRDGIAQPAIRSDNARELLHPPPLLRSRRWQDLVAPGEILLGYPNELGVHPPTPSVAAVDDPKRLLPPSLDDPRRSDFGRNGSYLVFRQLEQNVHAFWDFVAGRAAGVEERVRLAAQMVGRWPSGSPLAATPDRDAPVADLDDFDYSDDPWGERCPFGAHVRRANPRDSLGPTLAKSLRTARLHRILRRGRTYGTPADGWLDPAALLKTKSDKKPRGLHFLCLNANIGRQFEFIQHTWLNNPEFAGLATDVDPVAGHPTKGRTFTVPADPVRRRLTGLERFVTVKGGGYFFMPGLRALRYLGE